MITANTSVVVGKRIFMPGEIIPNLSDLDACWMRDKGLVTITPEKMDDKPQDVEADSGGKGETDGI